MSERIYSKFFVTFLVVVTWVNASTLGDNRIEKEPTLLSLEKAIEHTRSKHPSRAMIEASIDKANILTRKAWAILMPSLKVSGAFTRNNKEIALDLTQFSPANSSSNTSGNDPMPNALVIQELWGKNFGVNASMSLFNARAIPLIKYASLNKEAAEYKRRFDLNELANQVTMIYYQNLTAKEMIAIFQENRAVAEAFLHSSQVKQNNGQGTPIDVLRAEKELLEADSALLDSAESLNLAETAFLIMTGIDRPFTLQQPHLKPIEQNDRAILHNEALTKRLDLRGAKIGIELADQLTRETLANWLPNFDLSYNYSWDSAPGFAGENDSWRLIFAAQWTLFDGGLRYFEAKERQIDKTLARSNVRMLELSIISEVEQSASDYERAKRRQENTKKQLDLAEQTQILVSKQFKAGLVSSLEVVQANNLLNQARIQHLLELLSLDLASLKLKRSIGEIIE